MSLNTPADLPRAELRDASATVRYVLAGNAYVTFQSAKTGVHLTYHVRRAEPRQGDSRPAPWFVSVLTGPDHYEYLGTVFQGVQPHQVQPEHVHDYVFVHGCKSRISRDAKSAQAFAWVWGKLTAGRMPEVLSVYHEGRCGRCGRRLTTPESITTGLGPECAKKSEGGSR